MILKIQNVHVSRTKRIVKENQTKQTIKSPHMSMYHQRNQVDEELHLKSLH